MPMPALENGLKVLGAVAGIIALGFTGYQIYETNKTLLFTTEQGLYKESREILKFIAENPSLIQDMRSDDISKLDEKARVKLDAQIGILLNFYNSALLDKTKPYVSDQFRDALISDFCGLSKYAQIAKRLPTQPGKPFQSLADIRKSKCNA
jgi:hypothetical protein